jgi:hypothetical protein
MVQSNLEAERKDKALRSEWKAIEVDGKMPSWAKPGAAGIPRNEQGT